MNLRSFFLAALFSLYAGKTLDKTVRKMEIMRKNSFFWKRKKNLLPWIWFTQKMSPLSKNDEYLPKKW